MRRFLSSMALVLLLAGTSWGHDGLENETEIRVRRDRIEVTLRSSLRFAWRLLGERAPTDASDASFAKVKTELGELGKGLLEMNSGGNPVKLRTVACTLELEEHVAFTYVYEVPAGSPEIQFTALFFKKLGDLEEGTFRLIDLTRNPFRRDVEPTARKRLHRVDDSFSFTLADQGVKVVKNPVPAPASTPGSSPR